MQAPLMRPIYFTGQLLTARDFQAEQEYHQQKRRLLNRTLHGYGVVCGLLVTPTEPPDPARVTVEAGLALDASGREIVIPEPTKLDLSACLDEEESRERERPQWLFVTLEYEEKETESVPVLGPDGEEPSQPSRIEESYRLSLRREPVAHPQGSPDELLAAIAEVSRAGSPEALHRLLVQLVSRPFPGIPRDSALTLAAVEMGPGAVSEGQIDNVTHRRIVLSSTRVLEAMWLTGQKNR